MVQVKKAAVRGAILEAAERLFARQGYSSTQMSQIAREAGVSTSNIYVYFASKLAVVYAIFDPWMRERIERIEQEARAIAEPSARLRHILLALWEALPAENNGFANNLMQAVANARADDEYRRDLLDWLEDRLSAMIAECLPAARRGVVRDNLLAHMLFMAFDGFAMNRKLGGAPAPSTAAIVDLLHGLLLGRISKPR